MSSATPHSWRGARLPIGCAAPKLAINLGSPHHHYALMQMLANRAAQAQLGAEGRPTGTPLKFDVRRIVRPQG